MNRREFVALLAAASALGPLAGCTTSSRQPDLYSAKPFGSVRLLHITDTHAQLQPIYFREPSINLGFGNARGRFPHVVGRNLLSAIDEQDPMRAHAFTFLDFAEAAQRYGRVGGFAHLKTLIDQLRAEVGGDALLLDGGDTWQGSATALWSRGTDMVDACNLLGVDVMTGHWEFTYRADEVRANLDRFAGDFVAQNIVANEEALFDGLEVFDEDSGHVFAPYVIKRQGAARIAVIGQAFPYTPIANPRRFVSDYSFGIRERELQALVRHIRDVEKPDVVVLLSHNGMDVDLKLAGRVTGIDVILGGHTHDAVPKAMEIENRDGITLVTNAGSNGKFVGVLDLDLGNDAAPTQMRGYRYRLLPVFANLLPADPEMAQAIERVRQPHMEKLSEPLAVTDSLLYRRGNFNGTFDQIICDALTEQLDAQISFSPGFRWGTTVLPGDTVTMEDVWNQTAMTYPETYVRDMSGTELRSVLESVADNLFHPDPYYQQGGDMVRVGGMSYSCAPKSGTGKRIADMRLDNGDPIDPSGQYRVAGWATVGAQSEGPPVWDITADYLKDRKEVRVEQANMPVLKGVSQNPGFS